MTADPSTLRTFIAVDLPAATRQALAAVQDRARAHLSREGLERGVRWTRPDGIHLTLKFLGDTPADLVPELGDHLESVLAGLGAPRLALTGTGVFPSTRATRVIWVGLGGDIAALTALQSRIDAAVSPLGFPAETRPFSPHLTLARVADAVGRDERERIGAAMQRLRLDTDERFLADTVSLIRSDLLPGGAVYTPLRSVRLAAGS